MGICRWDILRLWEPPRCLTAKNFPIAAGKRLWVCEGAFDALALRAAGMPRVVAIFGVQGWRWAWTGLQGPGTAPSGRLARVSGPVM